MIRLRGVEKFYESGYGAPTCCARSISTSKEGEFVTIMGPSGAGKSTLLTSSACSTPTGRRVPVPRPPGPRAEAEAARGAQQAHIGFVFQSYHLIDNLTVYENLEVPLSYRNIKRAEREAWSATCSTASRSSASATSTQPALGRTAAAGGRGPRGHRQPQADPRRRAHRQPAHRAGARDHGAVQAAQRRGAPRSSRSPTPKNAAYGDRIVELCDGWIVKDPRQVAEQQPVAT
jgi:putative ABC transport system ATP-binding protein